MKRRSATVLNESKSADDVEENGKRRRTDRKKAAVVKSTSDNEENQSPKKEKLENIENEHAETHHKEEEGEGEVEGKPELSKAELKAEKIEKLKDLLQCIQQYAQFTATQLCEAKKFDLDLSMFRGDLRDYQNDGVRWLRMLHDLAINGILADEMGLGKTVMVLATLSTIIKNRAPGPFLVIAPLSTLPNWVSECERFLPDVPYILFHGSATKRKALRKEIMVDHKLPAKYAPAKHVRPIVITSYEMVINDANFLSTIDWRMMVVDEAQRLKNENCVLRVKLRKFTTLRRLILTGTPIQNGLTELWSLMSFLMPDIFKTGIGAFESILDEILSDDASVWVTDEEDAKQKEEIVNLLHSVRPLPAW